MDTKLLKQITLAKKEINYLNNKLKSDSTEMKKVIDSVSASSKEYPYTKHTVLVEGYENSKNKRKYKKLLKNKKIKLEKQINELEYELNSINDIELIMIIRYKYIDGLNYTQIAHEMSKGSSKVYTADGIRMKLKRELFEKNKKI